jgi:hypothetical protein
MNADKRMSNTPYLSAFIGVHLRLKIRLEEFSDD